MRIKHRYLKRDSHLKIILPVKKILEYYNVKYLYKEDINCVIPSHKYKLEFSLYEDSEYFTAIKTRLDRFSLYSQVGTEYEKADFEKAKWFIIRTGEFQYPQPESGFGYLQASFDLENYCKFCGIGKVQNSPFRLQSEPKQKQLQFWGLHWEFGAVFVRDPVKNILEREKIEAIRFSNPVLHRTNTAIKDLYQLHIDTILDQGFNYYNTKIITCKFNNEENCNSEKEQNYCGRIKYHHPMIGGYFFNKDIFKPEYDIVESYEYFGSGASAQKLQIVSKRFKTIVEKNKLKGLVFIPVVHDRFEQIKAGTSHPRP